MARKRLEGRAADVAADYSPSMPALAKDHAILRSQARAVLAHALLKPKAACAPKAGAPKAGAPKAGAPKADSPTTPSLASLSQVVQVGKQPAVQVGEQIQVVEDSLASKLKLLKTQFNLACKLKLTSKKVNGNGDGVVDQDQEQVVHGDGDGDAEQSEVLEQVLHGDGVGVVDKGEEQVVHGDGDGDAEEGQVLEVVVHGDGDVVGVATESPQQLAIENGDGAFENDECSSVDVIDENGKVIKLDAQLEDWQEMCAF